MESCVVAIAAGRRLIHSRYVDDALLACVERWAGVRTIKLSKLDRIRVRSYS
jgi:hypothetical protein